MFQIYEKRYIIVRPLPKVKNPETTLVDTLLCFKAFDAVNHETLISVLKPVGMSMEVETFFINYLSNRHQIYMLP